MPSHNFLGLPLSDWAAIATLVNGVTVVILVVINILYLRSANRQALAASAQARESQRQADAASESLKLLQSQLSEQNHRELVQAMSVLNEVKLSVMFWTDITDNKWGTAPDEVHLLPDDWSLVLLQAGRVSQELRGEVLEAFRMVGNAQYQISSFLGVPLNARDSRLMPPAHLNLVNAMPKLVNVTGMLELAEKQLSNVATKAE